MGEGSLSAEDIDALLGGGTPAAPSSGASSSELSDLDSLLGGGSSDSGSNAPSMDAISAALGTRSAPTPPPQKVSRASTGNSSTGNLSLLMDVTLTLTVELGRTQMSIKDILQLSEGAVIELDKNVGEDLDILVNGRMIGKGKIVIMDDYYGIQIVQISDPMQRLKEISF